MENPSFSADESKILFTDGNNLYALKLTGGELVQLTNFVKAASKDDKKDADETEQAKWLKASATGTFRYYKSKEIKMKKWTHRT